MRHFLDQARTRLKRQLRDPAGTGTDVGTYLHGTALEEAVSKAQTTFDRCVKAEELLAAAATRTPTRFTRRCSVPRSPPGDGIGARQSSARALDLQRAFRRAHGDAKRGASVRLAATTAFRAGAPPAILFWREASDGLAAAAGGWLLLARLALGPWQTGLVRSATGIQDRYDRLVFALPDPPACPRLRGRGDPRPGPPVPRRPGRPPVPGHAAGPRGGRGPDRATLRHRVDPPAAPGVGPGDPHRQHRSARGDPSPSPRSRAPGWPTTSWWCSCPCCPRCWTAGNSAWRTPGSPLSGPHSSQTTTTRSTTPPAAPHPSPRPWNGSRPSRPDCD
jgi:SMODS-associating 4TM effector domain